MEPTDYRAVLDAWFGNSGDDATVIDRQSGLWWGKDEKVDADLRRRFGPLLQDLEAGRLADWKETPPGRLAAIILADQIPRNIHRGTPAAFRTDPLALSLALEGLDSGDHRRLSLLQRVFFYLPLEHAESLECQDLSVALFEELLEEAEEGLRRSFRSYLDFARRHRDIIRRFDRFPHRNRILGRESTAEELAFLEEPGSSF
ncbi:MAG: DUF924 domain-containing protein [Gammaproteobacteria bacterium]